MTATDLAALLDTIAADPADYVSRLAYADWLEEQGDSRAELFHLAARPNLDRAAQKRLAYLRGTVSFLDEAQTEDARCALSGLASQDQSCLGVLASILDGAAHPLAPKIRELAGSITKTRYSGFSGRYTVLVFKQIEQSGGGWIASHGNGLHTRGRYPTAFEAAIAGLAALAKHRATYQGPVKLWTGEETRRHMGATNRGVGMAPW